MEEPALTQERVDAQVSTFELNGEEYVVVSRPVEVVNAGLTEAELAVARLVAAGRSNERIAKLRGTTIRTVANQVASLLRKLDAPSRHHVGTKIGLR
jgi:DNA-binding CsgD family transcriptional regulator